MDLHTKCPDDQSDDSSPSSWCDWLLRWFAVGVCVPVGIACGLVLIRGAMWLIHSLVL